MTDVGGSPSYAHQALPLLHSFLIGEDGLVYEGRGWNIKGDHTGPTWNPISIGITFMGNYMGKHPAPWAGVVWGEETHRLCHLYAHDLVFSLDNGAIGTLR